MMKLKAILMRYIKLNVLNGDNFVVRGGWSACSLSRVMFSIGIIKKYCPTLGKWENIFISIAGCQTRGNIIRNVMETSVVLYLELGLPRQTCTLKSELEPQGIPFALQESRSAAFSSRAVSACLAVSRSNWWLTICLVWLELGMLCLLMQLPQV